MEERIQKILSQWGIASRRQAEKMILAGRVHLNGEKVNLGQKANPNIDHLEVDGKLIKNANRPKRVYLLLNKPAGVVSTCSDPQNRPTVIDLLSPELREGTGVHPVGRLDADSTGALILTNDGELTLHLTHPRYHLPKTYQVWVQGYPSEKVLDSWRQGVILAGKKTLPASIKIIKQSRERTLLEVIITEGRNRQIRRVSSQLGHEVIALHRQAIASIPLQLPNQKKLLEGQYRFLQDSEVKFLYNHIHFITGKTPGDIQEIRT